jgi:SNF2 family DNA or RNA helicase
MMECGNIVDLAKRRPVWLSPPPEAEAMATLDYVDNSDEDSESAGDPRWAIEGSPVCVVAAMKVFSGAISKSRDRVSFPAAEASFEDLLMLRHRYPLKLTDAAKGVWDSQYTALVVSFDGGPPPVPPERRCFKGTLLPFQQDGVAFMAAQRKCLLADDMGLGKTVMAFGLLDRMQAYPALIVCQPHVQRHWERKLEEFMTVRPAGANLLARGACNHAPTWLSLMGAKAPDDTPEADIYIVHYLVLHAWACLLKGRGIRTAVFDEVQELRHNSTRKYDSARLISRAAQNVVGLSGTPIYNRGGEILHVLNAISKGCLGTQTDFLRTWCASGYGHQADVVGEPENLGNYLRDRKLMLRRLKEDVQSELPPKRCVVEPIDADRAEFANLVRAAAELARQAQEATDPFDRARMEQEAMAQTRRATGIAKSPAAISFLRGLMEVGEPTLVFAHHHAVVDAIKESLEEFNPVCITGRENQTVKTQAQDDFAAGKTNLCLISLRAATGIDGLQKRARCVVFAELDWSPAVHRQAEDRAHRMGQKESVIVYYLVTDLGTDPDMLALLGLKKWQFAGLMQEKEESEDARAAAESAAKDHMQNVLAMLRQVR